MWKFNIEKVNLNDGNMFFLVSSICVVLVDTLKITSEVLQSILVTLKNENKALLLRLV